MEKYQDDKFIKLVFKENKNTRFNGIKPVDNLANFGGLIGSRYFVARNGEYNGIIIELEENLLPIYLSNSVHQFYICVESNYINVNILVERFGLGNLYQVYSNELIRFVVDEFVISNNLQAIYNDYLKIKTNLEKDNKLIELKKLIWCDCQELIPVKIKIVGTGSLLPSEWMNKSFGSGKEFHLAIDQLDERIGKPPVTYLANYCMVKQHISKPELIDKKILSQYTNTSNYNIFVLDSIKLKFDLGPSFIKKDINYYWIELEFDSTEIKLNNLIEDNKKNNSFSSKVLILYEKDKIMNEPDKFDSINTSIGFNVSLLQKSIRRGKETINCLKEAIKNLSKARPFNNPEYSYEMVSGSRQLMWRCFITIIEESKIYKSSKYLDILDFVLYTFIFARYPSYFISEKLSKLVELTCIEIQASNIFWDFRPYNSIKLNTLPPYITNDIKIRQFQLALLAGIKLMPGMRGDKLMLDSTIKWLETNPDLPNLQELCKLDKLDISSKLMEKINWFSSLDHHSNPNLITQLHNGLYGLDFKNNFYGIKEHITLEKISGLIWESNSKYNFRKHSFEWNKLNDLIYLTQNFLNKTKSININLNLNELSELENLKNYDYNNSLCLEAEINLILNLTKYEKEKLFWSSQFNSIMSTHEICEYSNTIEANRIGQFILSNQYSNCFWFKGKKTTPIYVNDEIKFKQGDKIYDTNTESEDKEIYNKIFNYYLTNYKAKIVVRNKIFNTNIFYVEIKSSRSIFINGLECVKINHDDKIKQTKQIEWINEGLEKFIRDEKIILHNNAISDKLFIDKLKYIISIDNPNPITKYISYKSLCETFKLENISQMIGNKILEFIPDWAIKKLICRIETSIEDKNDRVILLLGKIDRGGKASTEAVDNDDEGYLIRLVNILACLYGCFEKINETKFIIHTYSKVYKFWLDKLEYIKNKKNKTNNANEKNKIKQNEKFIKTKLWKHQITVRDMIINGIINYKQKGWGDASNVGSGKTLTGLSVIEAIWTKLVDTSKNNGETNFLILTPNTNLYAVWKDEISTHCDISKINCWEQNANGTWKFINFDNIVNDNMANKINIYISTMGRNRDNPLKSPISFVIIDECLTVQNNTSKWTMKAFEQVVRSQFGVLMLSATFFRTRFDKLFFMLKMFQLQIPSKPEYLDTILNIAIGANIKTNPTQWIETIHKIQMDKEFYVLYSKHKKANKKESYLELKKFMSSNVDWENLIVEKTNELIKMGRKVLIFAESDNQLEKLNNLVKNLIDKKNVQHSWSFYPDISNNICVISKHKGTYGINNLVKYDTILMKPPEPDKLPQMKGRLDRPGQIATKLYIEYIVVADTIDEIDLISLQIANNFYSSHIVPLANYYSKYA